MICKFFLQGKCKFGKNCRFEHPVNGANISSDMSTGRTAESHSFSKFQSSKAQEDDSKRYPTLNEVIAEDLSGSLLYKYSCYGNAFSNMKNIISGDISPEELRLKAYDEGRSTGSLTNYTAFVQQIEEYYGNRWRAICQNPQAVIETVLSTGSFPSVHNVSHTNSNAFSTPAFSNATHSNVFASAHSIAPANAFVQSHNFVQQPPIMPFHGVSHIQNGFSNAGTNNINPFPHSAFSNATPVQTTLATTHLVQQKRVFPMPSVEDVAEYRKEAFELGKIPELPPTHEFCVS